MSGEEGDYQDEGEAKPWILPRFLAVASLLAFLAMTLNIASREEKHMKVNIEGREYEGREIKSWTVRNKNGRGFTVHLVEVNLPNGVTRRVKVMEKL
jgi:hypothetical protein